jgi:hypothetical protein
MLAPKVAKPEPKTAEWPSSNLAPQRATPVGHRPGHDPAEQTRVHQRSFGNQPTSRLPAQRAANQPRDQPHSHNGQETDPASPTTRSAMPGVTWDFSKVALFPTDRATQPHAPLSAARTPALGVIQPKLAIGRVDDPLEYEADRVADEVMRIPAAGVAQRKCAACEDDETAVRKSPAFADAAPLAMRRGPVVRPAITVMRARAAPVIRRQWSDASTSGAKSAETTAPTGGWNQAETMIAGVRRIPLEGITGGNTEPDPQSATKEAADNRVIVLIPSPLDTTQPIDVLLHLHGHNVGYRQRTTKGKDDATLAPGTVRDIDSDRIEQQIAASKRPIIGVLPQGTAGSGFGKLNADAYIATVFTALTAAGAWGLPVIEAPKVGRVILTGHSGAGGRISEMIAEPGAPRLPSALAEVALFDAINGPGELGIITTWVLNHLDADLAALMAGGIATGVMTQQQADYLHTSMRFRAYYTNSSYQARHEKLQASIDGWFKTNGGMLGGVSSPLYTQLYDNYRTAPVHHGAHNLIMGKDDRLRDALSTLPPVGSSAPLVLPKFASQTYPAAVAPEAVEQTLRTQGTTLDPASRAFMEARFCYDFSRVRIHADAQAAESAAAINARAYTLGDHVVFASGAYAPHSQAGSRLLAHELVHVVQQGHAAPRQAEPGFAAPGFAETGHQAAETNRAVQRQPAPAAVAQDLLPIRADENKKSLQTYDVGRFLVFVPDNVILSTRGDEDTPNLKVHIFFSAGAVQGEIGNDVLTHGMRGAESGSGFVLIGVPSHDTISDAEIRQCLTAVQITGPITAIRMSAHSRGAFSLLNTVVQHKIGDVGLIEHVTLFDADELAGPGGVTVTPKSQLLVAAGIPAANITAIEVNVRKKHTPGVEYDTIDPGCAAAIGYVRLIEDAMVTDPGVSGMVAANRAIADQLASLPLPPRGSFTSKDPTAPTSIQKFCKDHSTVIASILSRQANRNSGLLWFINTNDLARFGGFKFDFGLSAHHFIVAELAQEVTE